VRYVEAFLAGVALAALTLGLGVIVIATPGFTRAVSLWAGSVELSGLEEELAIEQAEEVRRFVTGASEGPLLAEVGGRDGFDEAAVAHLRDVRRLVSASRIMTGVVSALLAAWVVWCLARRRMSSLSDGLAAGAIVTGVIVLGVGAFALLDFRAAFTWFHGLFFEAGTWTFSYDALLIQLFPVPFWAVAGGAWGVWILVSTVLMIWGAIALRRTPPPSGMTTG
jgi:integral membrane protein (TIGR01906 family)